MGEAKLPTLEGEMGAPLRVLIVEDSEDDTQLLVRELRRGGYEVTYQRVATLDRLDDALSTNWDLIITDYSMPGFNGLSALSAVRGRGLETPFLFVSGTIGEETAVTAMKLGAQDYIMKSNLARLLPATARELADAEVRRDSKRLEQQVRQLQKFEAIGRLAGGIAHDFNNVLGAILGWAELGESQAPKEPASQLPFKRIREQAQHAAGLTSQLLAFARRQILEPRNVNLNDIVRQTTSLLQNVIGETIEVVTGLAPELAVTRADPTQIEQVLMNLCLNARDAMPEGGRLGIRTSEIEFDDDYCRHHAYMRPGRYVLLSVSDTGAGMDAATADRVFEPFFTTKTKGKGTGLGLATTYGIVKQHNGFIDVDSALGRGSLFRVYLPAGAGPADPRTETDRDSVQRGTETILVAEDHEGLREIAQCMLEELGYHVLLARDGEEALCIFQKNQERIALALLDVVMPRMNGTDAYARMFAIDPNLPAIFVTGYSADVPLLSPNLNKDLAVLQKPYTRKALGRKVREVLDQA